MHVVVLAGIIIAGSLLGLRVIVDSTMAIDWNAVTAVGTWCTAIVPIFLVFLTAHISLIVERERQNVVQSNLHLYEEIKGDIPNDEIDEEYLLQRTLACIRIGLVCTTEEISEFIKKDDSTTIHLLSLLENEGKIETVDKARQLNDKHQAWKEKREEVKTL